MTAGLPVAPAAVPSGAASGAAGPAGGLSGTLDLAAAAVAAGVASIPRAVLADGAPASPDAIDLISTVAGSRIAVGIGRAHALASLAAAATASTGSRRPVLPPAVPAPDSARVLASTRAVVDAAVTRVRSATEPLASLTDIVDARALLDTYAADPRADRALVTELTSVLGRLARGEFYSAFNTNYLLSLQVVGDGAGAGWVRQTTSNPCGQCQTWSDGKVRPFTVVMKTHNNDECIARPVTTEEARDRDRTAAREPVAHRGAVNALDAARRAADDGAAGDHAGSDPGGITGSDPEPAR